jgi:arylsulfatase A-like enzyme
LVLPDHIGEDSVSLLSLLKGQTAPVRQSVIHHSINGAFAIRTQRWKLELCPGSGGWSAPTDQQARAQKRSAWQLYDLVADVAETNNVIAAHADVVETLRKELQACIARGRSTPGPEQANDVKILLDASCTP